MKKNGIWVKTLQNCKEVECHHQYAWTGKIPCTGMLKCVFCGKPKDENSPNGEPLIFGKTWEEIQNMQQKTYQPSIVDTSVPGKQLATKNDIALLEKYGEAGLKEKKYYGVLDRLGLLKNED